MPKGRQTAKAKAIAKRDAGPFVALPMSVLDCQAFTRLSYPAKALLLELARQYHGDDNGRLLLSRKLLAKRGWTSPEVIQRARDQLIASGFVFEMVKGQRPNKASWYAISWQSLDQLEGFDRGAAACFKKGAYREPLLAQKPELSTPAVQGPPRIGTFPEQGPPAACTSPVPVTAIMPRKPCTSTVHPLEMPSAGGLVVGAR